MIYEIKNTLHENRSILNIVEEKSGELKIISLYITQDEAQTKDWKSRAVEQLHPIQCMCNWST